MPEDRRLAAIMFTDIVGYTALMGSDEDKAFKVLRKNREIQRPIIKRYRGEWLKEMGDGILASFRTASDAVRCAGEIQQAVKKEGIGLRIGIHEGEVVFEGGDVLGDGVNVASRLEEMAEEGAIIISGAVYKDVKNKAGITAEFIDEKELKNVEEPVKVYRVHSEEKKVQERIKRSSFSKKKRYPYYIIGSLVILIAALIIWNLLPSNDSTLYSGDDMKAIPNKSIAVLPFRNDSPDQENEYFCNGIMEEILTNLQKISDLDVRSRTSVEKYRITEKDIITIASELGVKYVVEGSVQKIGDNIKIIAQLIDAESDNHLWAEIYEGDYTNEIFKFQSRTALNIASSLNAVITPQEKMLITKPPTSDITAYDYLIQGQYMVKNYWRTMDRKYLILAHDLYNKGLELDPNYSRAISLKMGIFFAENQYDSTLKYAKKYIILNPDIARGYYYEGECYRFMLKYKPAIKSLKKAVALAPNHAWSNLALGSAYICYKNEELNGFKYLQKALESSEGQFQSGILLNIGINFSHIGDYARADKYIKKAIDQEVGCLGISTYSRILSVKGKFSEAISFLDSICNDSFCKMDCNRQYFYNFLYIQNFEKAEEYFQRLVTDRGEPDALDSLHLAYLYRKTNRIGEANKTEDLIRQSLEINPKPLKHMFYQIEMDYYSLQLQEIEMAIKKLSLLEERGFIFGWHDFLEINPLFEDLWDDPEFQTIIKRSQEEKATVRAKVDEMINSGEINL